MKKSVFFLQPSALVSEVRFRGILREDKDLSGLHGCGSFLLPKLSCFPDAMLFSVSCSFLK
jgi:hypothetical protein